MNKSRIKASLHFQNNFATKTIFFSEMLKITFLLLVYVINYVTPHSWIACSDYAEKNGAYWDAKKCRGYPRDASRFAQKNSFGQDRGEMNFLFYAFMI